MGRDNRFTLTFSGITYESLLTNGLLVGLVNVQNLSKGTDMSQVITGITSKELFKAIEELEIEDSMSLLKIFDKALLQNKIIKKSFYILREEEIVYGEFIVYGDNSEEFLWKLTIH